jgi:hypothetical protein
LNAQRYRAADVDAQGRVLRHDVWMGQQLLALIEPGAAT